MSESEAMAGCRTAKVGVSAIETLPAGGIRLVCNSVDGADLIRRKFKSKIIKVEQQRRLHRPTSPLW
ncbi:MAG TPA: hypothetical protein VN106_11825 [Sphingomicrobium sp.]|nr:hypothetical protein [Sphingomicrobium sp.]